MRSERPPKPGKGKAPTVIGSVDRAMSILDLFAQKAGPLAVSEVGRALGLNPSTTHHLMSTMLQRGYLEQDAATRRYRLGLKALQLGFAARRSYSLLELAGPVLAELCGSVDENVNLAVLEGAEMVYGHQVASSRAIAMFTRLGARAPLYCTAVGKAYLAYLDRARAWRLLPEPPYPGFTPHTVTDAPALAAELDRIRGCGWALDREEREAGVVCVAAPALDQAGSPAAALSVSGPSTRVLDRLPELAAATVAAAGRLSARLGHDA